MAADTVGEEFVTIVPVGEGRPLEKDPSFVTVLTVGAAAGAAEVVVRRPRGERLGLGLKFEGGSAAAEKVRRLLVQSCAEDSPAANACTPWGHLIPGDEILAIDGVSVSELTRIDCVRRLKDSDEKLTLLVRHFESENSKEESKEIMSDINGTLTSTIPKQITEIVRPTTLPPPVPPRKLGKKNSFKDKSSLQTVGEQCVNNDSSQQNEKDSIINSKHNGISTLTKLSRKSSFDSHILRQNKESIAYLKKGSPEEVRRLVRRLSDGKAMPPDAEIYIDLLSSEWERCLVLADTESDDTGSSISTVVDRLGSMASSVENSIPSTPIMQQKTLDIQKVLNYIENLNETDDILRDITKKTLSHRQMDTKIVEKSMATVNGFSHNSTTINSLPNEELVQTKKIVQNDKNNNNTPIPNKTNDHCTEKNVKNNDSKIVEVAEKPKPMPRNTRVERSASERKPRPIPIPETPPPSVPESLLTPTKKNCIETWLKRSEAEMNNNKSTEKLEENSMPEVLPRLIDFVPKPQFKENTHDAPQSLTRPTTAPPPPPPPAETREDGSGASLDTIGEMDESSDVTDNAKPIITTKTKDRKSSFERSFWEDRINKSDTEDKSLSNDETPLPSCPRQPPDGVETPSDVVEKAPDPPSRLPPLHFLRPRYSYTSRTQDARSEASVKDKIAMFSNDHAISTDRIDKCGTLPNRNAVAARKSTTIMYNYSEASSLDRRLTKSQDNLDELPRYSKKPIESRPDVSGGFGITTSSTNYGVIKPSRTLHSENKPLFYGSTTVLPSSMESTLNQPPVFHMRSTSDDSGSKNISKHKSNLEHLIEQRKKSMSKLRGLVIPEMQGPVVGLPEIKIQDNVTKSFLLNASENNNSKINTSKQNHVKPLILNETKWKTNFTNNIPKYSPAFKRKSLQVYTPSSMSKESTPERNFNERIETLNKINNKSNLNKMRTLDLNDTPKQLSTSILPSKGFLANTYSSKKEYNNFLNNSRDYKNLDIKICTVTDIVDSDNDSAMSSTQSSYRSSASSPMRLDTIESDSSRLSPRILNYTYSVVKSDIPANKSPTEKSYEEYIKRSVCRSMSSDTNVSLSSSAGSAATSGSQASCSSLESSVADSDKRKVSKTCNIDTLNRRNILASAKCRSGRDAKLSSPVIETKFSHESCDRSPSPVPKASERLSTLTPSVSAVSNKGENRRRNKIIAESDSDSDSDVNIRQRKTDFKNSRLKRNSSSANKPKSNDTNSESPKAEDAPRVISEKIIKEINKAGLDNFTVTKGSALLDKNGFDIIKTDTNKEEKSLRNNISIIPRESKVCDIQFKEKSLTKVNSRNTVHELDKVEVNGGSSIIQDAKISTRTIRLRRGEGTGVGVILAGGIDCEAKDVTVHRILADSVAARAGLKRGVKVRSINGFAMTGLTHAQSVTILKEQRSEVVIEVENETIDSASDIKGGSDKAESKVRQEVEGVSGGSKSSSVVTVLLEKAGGGAGLGFGLDGGRDSPRGDCPLTIKKLFAGGAAAQSGQVVVGAQLLSAGGQSMEGFTRTQAWAALKALPPGPVALVLSNPK